MNYVMRKMVTALSKWLDVHIGLDLRSAGYDNFLSRLTEDPNDYNTLDHRLGEGPHPLPG